uniref:Uncharacterized protein n=1 Tax=Anguilla anguilla TaxID=7936 RepID=A0A0E9WH16_ANGAN
MGRLSRLYPRRLCLSNAETLPQIQIQGTLQNRHVKSLAREIHQEEIISILRFSPRIQRVFSSAPMLCWETRSSLVLHSCLNSFFRYITDFNDLKRRKNTGTLSVCNLLNFKRIP